MLQVRLYADPQQEEWWCHLPLPFCPRPPSPGCCRESVEETIIYLYLTVVTH